MGQINMPVGYFSQSLPICNLWYKKKILFKFPTSLFFNDKKNFNLYVEKIIFTEKFETSIMNSHLPFACIQLNSSGNLRIPAHQALKCREVTEWMPSGK